ncbi:MAG: SAM-dependent methyltransferase [Gemmatimonadetes bacterium]|nr:SAM-dependent methyltransferase [Gemmatimonadota bacterium]
MLTTRDAARLLAAAGHEAPLASLSTALGFADPLRILPRDVARLGIDDPPRRVRVAAGRESLRALLLEWDAGPALRDRIATTARAVARRSPELHWIVIAAHRTRGELLIAAPDAASRDAVPALLMEARQLRESDAETFAALSAAADLGAAGAATLVHLRWRETLGRDALTRRFYRDLESAVSTLARTAAGRADADDRRTIALLTTSRLLFLSFLEAKGWLDRDRAFLRHQMERVAAAERLHDRLLDPLFFGTLNTPVPRRASAARAFGRVPFLNGGLFQRSGVETRCRGLRLTDDAIAGVIGDLLPRYRLTARETTTELSDAAVDPEMLGRAFESLMAGETRRRQGAFYTPHPLISRLTERALAALAAAGGDRRLEAIRVLDPACGSGAFLVHALESIAALRIAQGDARSLGTVRREVLTRSIFGVDIDPTAVWLCQLRLWLSVVVEDDRDDPMHFPPLPNLDRNVREGDALSGPGFDEAVVPDGADLAPMRLRYARASGVRKRTLARALDVAERKRALGAAARRVERLTHERRELLLAARAPDLFQSRRMPDAATRRALDAVRESLRRERASIRRLRDGGALPFSFATHFPEVAAGFDLVLGNPPWVRPHDVDPAMRDALRERFVTFRQAAWESGAESAGAGRGFASQADLAAVFTERAVQLTRLGGVIALLLPAKLWNALAGGGVRDLLRRRTTLVGLELWMDGGAGFDAVVYPSALIARCSPDTSGSPVRGAPLRGSPVRVSLHCTGASRAWDTPATSLALDASRGAPWLLIPPPVRAGFDALAAAGRPLADTPFGRPMLGVKSGCNEAFVVEASAMEASATRAPSDAVAVRSGALCGTVESSHLRPLARGEHVRAWSLTEEAQRSSIIWTHDTRGIPAESLRPLARAWLTPWRQRLEGRSDARGARWWALFRTEAARSDRPRVVWGDIGRSPRALVLETGDRTVPLNTCYVIRTTVADDAHALAALINSPLAAAWLNAIAEPARGGYHRYLGWTCARLPVPTDWPRARALLSPLGREGAAGRPPSDERLVRVACEAYGIERRVVAALLAWNDG